MQAGVQLGHLFLLRRRVRESHRHKWCLKSTIGKDQLATSLSVLSAGSTFCSSRLYCTKKVWPWVTDRGKSAAWEAYKRLFFRATIFLMQACQPIRSVQKAGRRRGRCNSLRPSDLVSPRKAYDDFLMWFFFCGSELDIKFSRLR